MSGQDTISERPGVGATGHWLLTQARELVENQKVVQVDAEASVEEACDALIEHGIQSVPLYDSKSHSYVGMFDVHDLAAYILARRGSVGGRTRSVSQSSDTGSPLARQAMEHLDGGRRGSRSDAVSRISDLSHLNPFYSVVPETTVAQVAQVFAKGAHRVAVMESERAIRGILSQARVVRFFFEHSDDATSGAEKLLLDASLESLRLVTRDVVTVSPDTPVLKALSLLESHRITSLPLVDAAGCLVGNLSLSDVKYLARERHMAASSCRELVQAARYWQGMRDGQDRAAIFSARPQATLRYVLAKLIATGAHRIWIVEPPAGAMHRESSGLTGSSDNGGARRASVSSASSQTVPVDLNRFAGEFGDTVCGVVSLTDILRLIVDAAPKPRADPEYNYASMD
ncbi:cell separation during budding [Coemansia brasiliensis]|uniref:Cell separation during budding n=1 Tax=Coemansia brasiliensis TaxID=2650707 RepID=A0A9W8IH61_9FUNG|nr:cell separation during budding [Coemansia brasiliensis]